MRARTEVVCLLALIFISGCGGGGSPAGGGSTGATKRAIKGALHGGQSPICNSTVTLYAGLDSPVCGTARTDSSGNFSLTDICPAPGATQMYLVATGGGPKTNFCAASNDALGLSAALGRYDSLPRSVNIDEVTTVASVWALNQFLDSSGQFPEGGTNPTGLANAAMAVTSENLVDIATGKAPNSFGPGVISPTAKLYSLANILATCVNTNSAASTPCQKLLCLSAPGGSYNSGCS